MKILLAFVLIAASLPVVSFGQEVTLGYTYVRANAPPGQCDCFNMNGASVSFAQPFTDPHYAGIFDATFVHASGISAGDYDLTLAIYSLGFRYRPMPVAQWNPFAHLLLGASHASGSLVEGDTPAAHDARFVFASTLGGGIDYRIDERWSVRVLEADYLLDLYRNRTNDHQNNLRLSVGASFHFGAGN